MVTTLQNQKGREEGVHYLLSSSAPLLRKGGLSEVYMGYKVNEDTEKTCPVAIEIVHGIYSNKLAYNKFLLGYFYHSYCQDNLLVKLDIVNLNNEDTYIVTDFPKGVILSDLLGGKTTDYWGWNVPFAQEMLNAYQHNSENFAITIAINILAALATLHEHGMIHYRVCPSNILLTESGQIKLIDFFFDSPFSPKSLLTNSRYPLSPLNPDNLGYYAPEYIKSRELLKPLNPSSSDTFSVGILLYRCTTGHLPFCGNYFEILKSILCCNLQLKRIDNKRLRKVIAKACDKRPNLRFQSARDMSECLCSILSDDFDSI